MAYSAPDAEVDKTEIQLDGKAVNIPVDVLNGTWKYGDWRLLDTEEGWGFYDKQIYYDGWGSLHIESDHTVDFGDNIVQCNVDNEGTIAGGTFTRKVTLKDGSHVTGGIFLGDSGMFEQMRDQYVPEGTPINYVEFQNTDHSVAVNNAIKAENESYFEVIVVGERTINVTFENSCLDKWMVDWKVGGQESGEDKTEEIDEAVLKLKLGGTVDGDIIGNPSHPVTVTPLVELEFDADGVPTSEGNEESGWEYYDEEYLFLYPGYELDYSGLISTMVICEGGTIKNGTFTNAVQLVASGRPETGYVLSKIEGGTFQYDAGNGEMSGIIFNEFGIISGGTFEEGCSIVNYGTIEDGAVFEKGSKIYNIAQIDGHDNDVIGEIKGGVFYGDVQNGGSLYDDEDDADEEVPGKITGGLFATEPEQGGNVETHIGFPIISTAADLTMNGVEGQKFWTVEGYDIELNANVPSGQKFTKWTGAELEAVNPVTLTMPDSNVTIGFETEKVTETKPGTGETEPGTGETKPGETKPGTGETKPGETKPGTGETKPGDTKPGTGETKPGETNPGTGETKPGTGETNPGTAEEKPTEEGLGAAAAVLTAVGATAVAGSGVAVLGFTAYQMGVELAAQLFLPDGASIPSTRTELALILWKAAGSPAVTLAEGETLTDTQTALRWAVDNNILSADGNEEVSKLDVLKAAYRVKNF